MPMRDRLARLVQRNPERPTLRQRAAALKASAAKVMRRKPTSADAPAIATEPAALRLADAISNPDAALLRLGHALEVAIAAEREACARADAAIRASGPSKHEDPEAEAEAEAAGATAADLARQVAEMPAHTANGLRLKIRALIHYDPHSFKAPPDDPDPHHILAHSLRLDAERDEHIAARGAFAADEGAPVALIGTDAEFMRLEREWDAARVREEDGYARQREIGQTNPGPGTAPQAMPEWREWHEKARAWRQSSGIEEAEEDAQHWCGVVDDIARQIAALPATSLTGMRIKARVLQYAEEIEVDPVCGLVGGLAHDVLALSPEALPEDARALALVDAIEREWAEWSEGAARDYQARGPEVDARHAVREARRDALLYAAIGLPASTRGERHAKALAHAWIGVVEAWQFKRPRENYKFDELLAFDIDAALAPNGMAGDPTCPTAAPDSQRPVVPPIQPDTELHQRPSREAPIGHDTRALPDFSALSIQQLSNLYERFTRAADFWNDAVHLPFAIEGGQASRFRDLNAAGKIMDDEGNRAGHLRDAVAHEISERDFPDCAMDQDVQLEAKIRHEVACNGSLRHAPTLVMQINEQWSA